MIWTCAFIYFFFEISILVNANEEFHFGILNHQTQWAFHCPNNNTKIVHPPSNDQPLISYECPHRSTLIEILPIELDLTFLCRIQSRLFWIIIDLYQYNTNFWLIRNENLDIEIILNNHIQLNHSKIEVKNYTNRLIMINAFYISFESMEILSNQPIQIDIRLRNLQKLNQCQFLIRDSSLWERFLNQNCHSDQPSAFSIQFARCDFYANQFTPSESIDNHLDVRIIDDQPITTTPEYNRTLSVYIEQPIQMNETSPFRDHYLLIEENYRQILSSLARSDRYSFLLKLIFIFLLIILLLLILLFLYMLCYHYHHRSRSSNSGKQFSVSI